MRFSLPCAPTRPRVLKPVCLFAAFLSVFLLPASATAQTDNSYGLFAGQQPYQMYAENSIESVNFVNGNLNLQIPLLSYKQRGSLPPVTFEIVYNANQWTLSPPGTPGGFGQPVQQQFFELYYGGADFTVSPFFGGTELSETYTSPDFAPYTFTHSAVSDASGAVHILASLAPDQEPQIDRKRTLDASGYESTVVHDASHNVLHSSLLNADGIGWRDGVFSDPNGNAITPVYAADMLHIANYTDSGGRVLPLPDLYYSYNNENTPRLGCQTLQYPGPPGSPQIPLTFCYANIPAASPFGDGFAVDPNAHIIAVTSVTLPNGTQWQLHYNQYADLDTLTYPTGATVSYVWANNAGSGRSIQSRTVNTGKRSDTWTYAYDPGAYDPVTGLISPSMTTETDPAGNQIVHGGGSTKYIDAKSGLVSTTTYTYTGIASGIGSNVHFDGAASIRRKAITTLPNGLVKQTCWIYDNDTDTTCSGDQQQFDPNGLKYYDESEWQTPPPIPTPPGYQTPPPTPQPLVLGKLLYQYESDWGQGAPGPYIRKTLTHYKWQDDAGYLDANLLNAPASICVPLPGASSCTPSTADTASYSSYGYDEQNGSPAGVYGNQTSASVWTGSGPALKTSTVFTASGMPQNVTDPAGHTTTVTYDASGLYPSSVTAPSTNGIAHSTGLTYDDASGLLVSTTDENGGTTGYSYDAMSRATAVTSPTGKTSYTYFDASATQPLPYYTVSQAIDGSRTLTQQANLDGLGRAFTSILTSDPDGATSTDTVYDALGRVQSVTNPHRAAASPTDGTTTYSYDALGRTTGVTSPDGNTRSTSYAGNVTTSTDEAGSQWQQMTDGLGRLVQVMEPDPATGKPAYETDYAYDLNNNLLRVDQWGGPRGNPGDRVRSFAYDGASRLLAAAQPESGTTTYSYATPTGLCSGAASNVCSKTDARGLVVAYSYDELGRPTGTSYPNPNDATPASTYAYDTPKPGWTFPNQTFPNGQPVQQNHLKGRLSWSTNANATIAYGYDAGGRTELKAECTTANCAAGDHYDMHLAYDGLGNPTFTDLGRDALKDAATPNGGFYYGGLSLAYSTAGRFTGATADIVDATHPSSLAAIAHYDPLGHSVAATYGNVLDQTKAYTPRGALSDIVTSVPAYDVPRTDHWDYNPNGTSKDVKDSLYGGIVINYSFDKLNRLTESASSYEAVTYSYDPWGNRTALTGILGPIGAYAHTFDSNNHDQQLGFDPSGAEFTDGLNGYGYDSEQRLVQVSSNDALSGGTFLYQYDPEGKRVAKLHADGTVVSQYLYAPDGTLTTTLGPDGKLVRGVLYGGGEHLADWTAGTGVGGGRTELRFTDQVGSLATKFDQTGAGLQNCLQGAFGEGVVCSDGGVDWEETHFTDKLVDQESDQHYFGARYYNSNLGRFTTPDPSGLAYADPGNPQSLNAYAYALNNPLEFVDPTGLALQLSCMSVPDSVGSATGIDDVFSSDQTTVVGHPDRCTVSDDGQNTYQGTIPSQASQRVPLFRMAPSKGFFQSLACSLASPLLKAAGASHLTVGAGAGASAGGGLGLGGSIGGGVQAVADPGGNIGVAFSFSGTFPGPVFGFGAIAGGQASVSNARTISDLSGQALDANASGAIGPIAAGLDVSRAPGGVYSATATVGAGIGGKGAGLLSNYTFIPSLLSTNCW